MFARIPLHRYTLMLSSQHAEPPMTTSVNWMQWRPSRRVRNALIISLLLTLLFLFLQVSALSTHLHDLIPSPDARLPIDVEEVAEKVQWSDFAYVQYVTNTNYLCNSLMILEALHRLGAKADRIMMYPQEWKIADGSTLASEETKLLSQARDQYGAKLVPIQLQTIGRGDPTWKDSLTKLLAFNQTQYKRVISLDSDATVQNVSNSTEELCASQ